MPASQGMRLKGAFYPSIMKMADYDTQIAFGADPSVLRFFAKYSIEPEFREDLELVVFECATENWANTQKIWDQARSKQRETSIHLH